MSIFSKSLVVYLHLNRKAKEKECVYCGGKTPGSEYNFCSESCEFNFYDERAANERPEDDNDQEKEIILAEEKASKAMPFDIPDEAIYSPEYQREIYGEIKEEN